MVVYSINIAYLFSEVAIGGRERPSPDVLEELTAVVQLCRIVVQYFVCLLSLGFFFLCLLGKSSQIVQASRE